MARRSKHLLDASADAASTEVIQVISRAFDILRCFDAVTIRLGNREIAERCNAPRKAMTRDDLVNYIKGFDQRTKILIGIFEKSSGLLLGFLRNDVNFETNQFLVAMIIGEPEYRNSGVTNAVTVPFRDYFFEELGMDAMLATALSHNKPIIHYLYATGWTLDRTVPNAVKSNTGEGMFDLCFFSQTKEGWRAWKKARGK